MSVEVKNITNGLIWDSFTSIQPGKTKVVSDDDAKILLDANQAEEVSKPKPKTKLKNSSKE